MNETIVENFENMVQELVLNRIETARMDLAAISIDLICSRGKTRENP